MYSAFDKLHEYIYIYIGSALGVTEEIDFLILVKSGTRFTF